MAPRLTWTGGECVWPVPVVVDIGPHKPKVRGSGDALLWLRDLVATRTAGAC